MGRELLFSITKKNFKIDYFSGTGKGGQHRNKNQNCVRIHHIDSGAIATGQSSKERQSNLKEALINLSKTPKFKVWHTIKAAELLSGKTIEQEVEEAMKPENLKIEIKENGVWVEDKKANL